MRETYRDPEGPEEWQATVDQAKALLILEDARLYGLVSGGPAVNVPRCEDILRRGATLGYRPRPDAAKQFFRDFNHAQTEANRRCC